MTSPKAVALKPCPFCGEDARLHVEERPDDHRYPVDHWHAKVDCSMCPVTTEWSVVAERGAKKADPVKVAEVMATWNRRAALTAEKVADAVALWVAFDEQGMLLAHSKVQQGLSETLNWEPLYRVAPPAQTALTEDARDAAELYYALRKKAEQLGFKSIADVFDAALTAEKVAGESSDCIKLIRPNTGDEFRALRADSYGIAELLKEGWQIAPQPAQPVAQTLALTRAEIDRIAGSCMDSGRYALFMAYVDAALAAQPASGNKP